MVGPKIQGDPEPNRTGILPFMAYDESLAHRIREAVQDEPGITEKRMFGGLAFLVDGHLAVAASGPGGLMLRVDPATSSDLVDGVRVERMVMRGKEMNGWLWIADAASGSDAELDRFVRIGVDYARSLPPK